LLQATGYNRKCDNIVAARNATLPTTLAAAFERGERGREGTREDGNEEWRERGEGKNEKQAIK